MPRAKMPWETEKIAFEEWMMRFLKRAGAKRLIEMLSRLGPEDRKRELWYMEVRFRAQIRAVGLVESRRVKRVPIFEKGEL